MGVTATPELREQVDKAIALIDAQFPEFPPIPEGATVESLWREIVGLKGLVRKPKIQDSVRLLLESPDLSMIPIVLLAGIVKARYEMHGFECKCSASSVNWYISQKTLEWNIVPRHKKSE